MFNRTYDKGRFADRDLNADGHMTSEELRVFMQNQDPEVSEAQVREKFAVMDTNKDGKVTHKESVTTIRINLRRTLAGLERWNGSLETGDAGTLKGYYSLATYALFFAIFTYVVVAQLQVENQYKVDNVIRQNLLGQDDALAAIAAHEDFFDYLLSDFDIKLGEFNKGKGADTYPDGGVFGTLFEDKLYNEEALAPGDLGMLFQYNKLVGGVLITQKRSQTKPCPPSAYAAKKCGADDEKMQLRCVAFSGR